MTTPFIQKYVPESVDELMIDDKYKTFIKHLIEFDNMNVLFQGEDGYGKTSIIRCMLNDYIDKHSTGDKDKFRREFIDDNIMWLNQWDENIQSWREGLIIFCKKIQHFRCKKIVVLDDIDLLNNSFQQIIRSMIEEYSGKVHFICSCKNPQNVVETIQSRLYMIQLQPIKKTNIEKIFDHIVKENDLHIDDTAKYILLTRSTDIKHLISNLEKIKLLNYPSVGEKEMREILLNIQYTDFLEFFNLCISCAIEMAQTGDCTNSIFTKSYKILEKYYHDGYSVNDILEEMFSFLKQLNKIDDELRYKLIMCLMETISVFHTLHENPVELVFFTHLCITKLSAVPDIIEHGKKSESSDGTGDV